MNEIRAKQLEARKTKSSLAALYTTLLGEAAAVGKNAGNRETTDAEVMAVVKKFIKGLDETVMALCKSVQTTEVELAIDIAAAERAILEEFLPKQLTEDELHDMATGRGSMPDFMKYLKENYAGQYDGKLAATVAKSVY